jgi:hypothetical protein
MTLKSDLLAELQKIDGVESRHSPELGNIELLYRGRSFAHFHSDNELDLRFTKNVIKNLDLSHPTDSVNHPHRSPNSPWIEVRFNTAAEISRVSELVQLAVAAL